MSEQPQLHTSIISMVSLAAGIASKHPDMGQCQLDRLRSTGVPQHQIDAVVEIARHIRDEASEKLDTAFDEKSRHNEPTKIAAPDKSESCCSSTPSGTSCC
ncbi:MAG: hypothetical protein OEL79_06040 [Chromatiales bacterium]|nr:hypothetical protein [Chromatiales bacterium]